MQAADDEADDEDLKNEALPETETCSKGERITKQNITCLKPLQLKMLQSTNYVKKVSEQFPDIKVEISLQKNECSFEGDVDMVHSVTLNLVETLSGFGLNRINGKPEEQIELYKRRRVIEYINNKLEAHNIVCAWEVEGQMLVICSLEGDIAESTKLVEESVTETKFPISKKSSATLFSLEWQKELKNIQDKIEILYKVFSDKTLAEVTVITTDKEANGIVCRIKAFLKHF